MESGAGVAGNVFDRAILVKREDEAGVEPRPGGIFCGIRGNRRERGEGRETTRPLAVTDHHHHPGEIKREAPWGDGEVQVTIRVGPVRGRFVTADDGNAKREKKEETKKSQTDEKALMDGRRGAVEVELRADGKVRLDVGGTGEVDRRAAAVVDGAGAAGGFLSVEARLEELRAKAVAMVMDAERQADGTSLMRKSAEKARWAGRRGGMVRVLTVCPLCVRVCAAANSELDFSTEGMTDIPA